MKFQSMWDKCLGPISVAKHNIKPLQYSNPIHFAPYQTGFIVRKFLHREIEKILSQNKFEPAQTKWTALIVFAPKTGRTTPHFHRL